MIRLSSLALAAGLGLALTLAALPTASATAFTCGEPDPGSGGLVGRTLQYVGNLVVAVCAETLSYALYVCGVLIGPENCIVLA